MIASINEIKLVENYSKALFFVAHKNDILKVILGECEVMLSLLRLESKMDKILDASILEIEKKYSLIADLSAEFSFSGYMNRFLNELVDNKRFSLCQFILQKVIKKIHENFGRKFLTVTTCVDISDKEKEEIYAKLKKKYNQEIFIDYIIDPSILGGLVVSDGIKIYDDSIKNKLILLNKMSKLQFSEI